MGDPRENSLTCSIVPDDSHKIRGPTPPGIEPGSPWWEASALATRPPWPHFSLGFPTLHSRHCSPHAILLQIARQYIFKSHHRLPSGWLCQFYSVPLEGSKHSAGASQHPQVLTNPVPCCNGQEYLFRHWITSHIGSQHPPEGPQQSSAATEKHRIPESLHLFCDFQPQRPSDAKAKQKVLPTPLSSTNPSSVVIHLEVTLGHNNDVLLLVLARSTSSSLLHTCCHGQAGERSALTTRPTVEPHLNMPVDKPTPLFESPTQLPIRPHQIHIEIVRYGNVLLGLDHQWLKHPPKQPSSSDFKHYPSTTTPPAHPGESATTWSSQVIQVFKLGSGGTVARAYASYHCNLGSIPDGFTSGFSHVGIVLDDAACRLVLLGYCSFPRPCIPALLHPRVTFHVMSGDDRHLWVPAGKLVTQDKCHSRQTLAPLHPYSSCPLQGPCLYMTGDSTRPTVIASRAAAAASTRSCTHTNNSHDHPGAYRSSKFQFSSLLFTERLTPCPHKSRRQPINTMVVVLVADTAHCQCHYSMMTETRKGQVPENKTVRDAHGLAMNVKQETKLLPNFKKLLRKKKEQTFHAD
ncbi:hypothetical protein PR048_023120 [Dryococelus australis]|uniref:Uncharacterized protein n=1 Tax=Dryococelus australis TaxID=614101 RepID=A0ABQ9GT64_9NEOP|nr:hypothetical protein PR048_023120 [Dryococelus australis]